MATKSEQNNATVAVYKSHLEAEVGVKALKQSGFDLTKLSIVGRGYHTEQDIIGYYNTGQSVQYWGTTGVFWGGIWGMFFGSAFLLIPGIGPLVVAGPLVSWMVGALEGAAVGGGLGVLGAGLFGLGIPKDSLLRYETAVKADKFILIVHGTREDTARAREIIRSTSPEQIDQHQPEPARQIGFVVAV